MAEHVRATRPRSTGAAEERSALHRSSADGRAEVSNQAFQRLLGAGHAQTKLAVSTPGDAHEREADAIASRVMSMSAPAVPSTAAVSSSASSASLGRRAEDKKHKEDRPAGIRAEEEEREREPDEDGALQRKAAPAASSAAGDADAAVTAVRGRGQPLPTSEREFFEPRLGRDLANVRVQADSQAAASAASVGAQAYTVRDNVVFGSGRYAPGTGQGRSLLAHELAHVIQQSPDRVPPLPGGQETVGVGAGGGPESLSRQADGDDAATAPGAPAASTAVDTAAGPAAEVAQTELGEPTDEVELDAAPTFVPSGAVAEFLAGRRSGGPVHVRYGDVASGLLTVRERRGKYQTFGDRLQAIPLLHPGLQPLRAAGVEPVLAVRIDDSEVSGFVSLRRGANVLRNPSEITDWIRRHPAEMGWAGLSDLRVPEFVNRLEAGSLILRVNDLGFRLGGFMRGTASVGLVGDALTFDGSATVAVGGLSEVQLEVHRDETGLLGGRVEVPVTIANFSGHLLAVFSGGVVDITGQARYETEKLTGDVTLLVTDARTARDVALQRLDPSQVVASAEEASAPAAAEGARPGPRALAGWGVLDFAFTEWMTGQAQVIIDNEGHVTVVGEIAPPAEIELFPQRDFIRRLFTVELRTLYGVPLVGNVFLFANIGLDAMAKLGPARIYNIAVQGTYSTDPRVLNAFSIAATLNISAFAGLRLRGEGGAGVELLGHDIKAGVGVNALAGVRGYVEATPTIGYRETADPQQGRTGEFYLNGHMELAAQPFLGLGGDLFVELDSPWWSPAPDEKWTWPLGELEYPLPGQFGIGADVEYVLGSDEVPEIEFTEVDFNAERFMTDLVNDHVPRSSQGEQEQPGQWAEQGAGAAPTSAEPTVVDSQGAPGAGEVAQGQQPTRAATDDVSSRPAGEPQPGVVKAAALEGLERRLTRGDLTSSQELQSAVRAVYNEHRESGLRSLDVDIPDEHSLDIVIVASASAPERRTIAWADVFAPDHEDRALFERAPRFETNALVSVNGESVGRAVASSATGHAEENLISSTWPAVMNRIRQAPGRSRVVFAINRSPCHWRCTPALIAVIESVPAELRRRADFVLAPTGVYEPTENLTEEEVAVAAERYRSVASRLRAVGHEVSDYTVVSRAMLTEHTTRMSDLHQLAAAGWDIHQLSIRPRETSAGTVLAEAAHHVAVRAGRVQAGSGGGE